MSKRISHNIDDNFEICRPRADAMIHSLRAFGYDTRMAVADIIDNSIFAGAKNINVEYEWNEGKPWIMIIDDGQGMTDDVLFEAMRLGSRSPLEDRSADDLGRFGLGLKTASFSQCSFLSVKSLTRDGKSATRFWDLEKVQNTREWVLGITPPEESLEILSKLDKYKSGTAVLWQNLDRIVDFKDRKMVNAHDAFFRRMKDVHKYLEMVFHMFLEKKKLNINVGTAPCDPWDPYFSRHPFTVPMSEEKYEDSKISVIPYVLPHVSKRTEPETRNGSGPNGWNAQQGFYVYRNKRMIVSGGYLNFDLKAEEHCKLARIKVEITNDMDHEWSIDVRKAVAIPPDRLKNDLLRIAKAARQRASEVYRARTGVARKTGRHEVTKDIWLKEKRGEKITYRINRNNELIKLILEELHLSLKWTEKLFAIIEKTIPHRLIIMDGYEHEDCHVDLPDDLLPPDNDMLKLCRTLYERLISQGKTHEQAADFVCSMDYFCVNPSFRAHLDDCINRRSK